MSRELVVFYRAAACRRSSRSIKRASGTAEAQRCLFLLQLEAPVDQAPYDQFTDTLKNTLAANEHVLALVAIGSLAKRERLDRWSDHDFWVITTTAAQPDFLADLSWLPNYTAIVLALRPAQQYYTVLYQTGHIAEFAVFGLHDLSRGRLSQYQILFDKQDVTSHIHTIATQVLHERHDSYNAEATRGHFLISLCTGAARAARGEQLSASTYIFQYAVDALVNLITHHLPAQKPDLVDPFDSRRRFEARYPDISATLLPLLARPPIEAAQRLLDLAEQVFANATIAVAPQALVTTRAYLQRLRELSA